MIADADVVTMRRVFTHYIVQASASADTFRRSLGRALDWLFLLHLVPGGGKWAPRGRVALPGGDGRRISLGIG